MSSADLAATSVLGDLGDLLTAADNPWTLSVTHVASVLRRSPSAIRRWCADGWYVGGFLMARKIGGEWMIHGTRFADWLSGADALPEARSA